MTLLPYLHEYLKTNYFTFILFSILILSVFIKYSPAGAILKTDPSLKGIPSKKIFLYLTLFCLLGVALRLLWLSVCHYRPAFSWGELTHQQTWTEYNEINIDAALIKDGVWFRSAEGLAQARRPIGYPVFLGFFYAIFGANTHTLYILNLLLFVVSLFLVYKIASTIFDERAGLMAAFFYSIYPLSVYGTSLSLDEHLFMPLWFLGLYLLFLEIKGKKIRFALLWYGLIFGYATMTRTHGMFMPVVVGCAYFLIKRSWKQILTAVFVVYLIGQAINLPWTIRNYRQWGIYMPYTATFFNIYYANNPAVKRADKNGEIPKPGEEGYNASLTQAIAVYDVPQMEKISRQEVRRWILTHPGQFAFLGTARLLHFMGTSRERGIWAIDLVEQALKDRPDIKLKPEARHVFEEMAFGFYYVLFYFFLLGLIWIVRTWRSRSPIQQKTLTVIGTCFLFYLAEQFLIYPERKYRFPLEFFMLMAGSAFLNFLLYDFRPLDKLLKTSLRRDVP